MSRGLIAKESQNWSTTSEVDSSLLTRNEQRMWFIDRISQQPGVYVMMVALEVEGKVDLHALASAAEHVFNSHEALCARISIRDGKPFRQFTSQSIVRVLNGPAWRSAAPDEVIDRLELQDIDPEHDALLQLVLIPRDPKVTLMLLAVHHVAADGWAVDLLLRQISDRYVAAVSGANPEPVPSSGVAALLALDQDPLRDADLRYWRNVFADREEHADLPSDRARPPRRSDRGADLSVDLDAELADRLRQHARACGTTLFTVLFTGVGLLLRRLLEGPISLGTVVANRECLMVQDIIGLCANTVAVPLDIDTAATLEAAQDHVLSRLSAAYAHARASFSDVVEAVGRSSDMRRNPLFDVMVLYRDRDYGDAIQVPGLTATELNIPADTAQFDITFLFNACGDTLTLEAIYSVDLFDEDTVRRWVERLVVVLEQVVSEPQKLVVDLEVMTDSERQLVTVGWNDTVVPFPREMTLWDLFIRQARRTPDAVAVSSAGCGVQWSYGELSQRANAVAGGLIERGVGRGSRVAVCMARSPEVVAVLLGILGAGAAYVPLDSSHPAQRLASWQPMQTCA